MAKMTKLYPTHIPTTAFQKVILTLGSAIAGVTNPARDGTYKYAFYSIFSFFIFLFQINLDFNPSNALNIKNYLVCLVFKESISQVPARVRDTLRFKISNFYKMYIKCKIGF